MKRKASSVVSYGRVKLIYIYISSKVIQWVKALVTEHHTHNTWKTERINVKLKHTHTKLSNF